VQFRFLFLFFMISSIGWGQSVRFTRTSLNGALDLAKKQNKNIFIDTYASYCIPCKKMEVEFRDPELANYLNNNFVCVRVDMESDHAEDFKANYEIVFLPTLLFLNPQGDMRMSIDRLINARE